SRGVDRTKSYAALLLAMIGWGTEITVDKYAIEGIGPFSALLIEGAAASVVLGTLMLIRRPKRRVSLWAFAGLGALEPFLNYGTLNLALHSSGAAHSALLIALLPLFVLALGVLLAGESVDWRIGVACLVSTAGAVLLVGSNLSGSVGKGDALVLLSNVGSAASVLVVARLSLRASTLEITAYQFGFGFLFTLPVTGVLWATGAEDVPSLDQAPHLLAAVGVGLGGFALAYLLYNYAVGRVRISTAGAALNLIPLVGVLSAVALLGERLPLIAWLAGLLIVGGILLLPLESEAAPKPEHRDAEVAATS
ncbi:MAG: EamA family transporter, partial [Actinobacteria bacterium]|nr:EamA family transporter [Actinomycetota bacterium]